MKDRLPLLLIGIAFWELMIFVYSGWVTEDITLQYRLAARYSARTSHTLVLVTLIYMFRNGLSLIFSNESKRVIYFNLVALFSLNHIIHFYFLATNFRVNQMELISARTLGGAVVYTLIIAMPFLLYRVKKLSRFSYWGILNFWAAVVFVILATFFDRIRNPVPDTTPLLYYYVLMGVFVLVVVLNLKKSIIDFKHIAL
ncbi:MAG: hypothetical protein AAGA86_05285 [Bacteroidota bacterium]